MEYMVHIWGGAWNEDANPSIKKDLGIEEGYYYFTTLEERDAFIKKLKKPMYQSQGLMIDCVEGELTHKRTVFVGVFEYDGTRYVCHDDFGYEYPSESVVYMYEHGNFSCDCNRSLHIRRQHGDDTMPFLPCGSDVKLIDYQIVYLD